MGTFFKDDDFEFTTLLPLGSTYHKCTDVGQRLSTLIRIKNGGYEGWYREWRVTDQVRRFAERRRRSHDEREGGVLEGRNVSIIRHLYPRRHLGPFAVLAYLGSPSRVLRRGGAFRPPMREGRDPLRRHHAPRLLFSRRTALVDTDRCPSSKRQRLPHQRHVLPGRGGARARI
jgi:hypothetical protein